MQTIFKVDIRIFKLVFYNNLLKLYAKIRNLLL